MRGVAGPEVHVGKEDRQESAPGHRVPQDPPGGLRPQRLHPGAGPAHLQGRGEDADPEHPRGGLRPPAGGELLRRGRPGAQVRCEQRRLCLYK